MMTTSRVTYVRFVVGQRDEDSHVSQGLFQAAYTLRDSNQLETYEHDLLSEQLNWFNENLEPPDYLDDAGTERAICWFHPEAREAIDRIRHLAVLLEEYGHQVRMLTTDRPGKIVFRDKHQIVAYPFRDQRDQL